MRPILIISIMMAMGALTACQSTQSMPKNTHHHSQSHKNDAGNQLIKSSAKIGGKDFNAQVISTPDGNGGYQLTITPMGRESITKTIDAPVVDAAVGDLNHDGYPEILVFTQSVGSGSYGDVIAYSSNNGRSYSEVYLPQLTDTLSQGYMGHDEFVVKNNTLIRRYPVYLQQDTNANPQGKTRQIQYRMIDGEASRRFVVDRIIEF